jgi:S-disulfanyl-L-cysteine oxidoreductase SoxD
MPTRKIFAAAALLALTLDPGSALAEAPGLGRPITEAEIKAWDITPLPDGTNLPPGSGTSAQGAAIFAQKCAACHGENAAGGRNAGLVGAPPLAAGGIEANKTIANFWANSTTLFDFIRRAMPWTQPRTLTDNEVYALSAYILSLNKLIGENDTMDAETLPKVKMPNRDNFIIKFPDKI